MSDELRQYYEQELIFIRQMAAEFASKHPKIASRLQLEGLKESKDPHVERMIEAFALLTGRVRRKIDDEFPEIVESLLGLLYPHYLQPLPAMAVAQFQFDPQQSSPAEPTLVKAGSILNSLPVEGAECAFRCGYPVQVWPLKVSGASLRSAASASISGLPSDVASVLRIQVETVGGVKLPDLKLRELRFFLNGDSTAHYLLYELLFSHAQGVQVRTGAHAISLPADSIRPVGFEPGEGLLPYSDRSFPGYRLLQEYFHFPQKFFFFDVSGFDRISLHNFGSAFDLVILFRDSELRDQLPAIGQAVQKDTFQLGCTPIVNLFERSAETIRVSHSVTEHQVIPDRHRQNSTEVYSVDRVTSTAAYGDVEEARIYEPFYSHRHNYHGQESRCFWYAHRRASLRKGDDGTEVYLSLVDLDFQPTLPPSELVTVKVTCTNRDFVSRLRFRREWKELVGEALPLLQVRCVVLPISAVRPPMRNSLQWRLISHLSLNHLSIVQGGGREALQEILRLYCFQEDEDIRKRIAAIVDLRSHGSVSRVLFDSGVAFCRGLDLDIEFDEDQFAGSGVFLFASVLERFFGLYSAINSYSRLTAHSRQRRAPLKKWPARSGQQRLL